MAELLQVEDLTKNFGGLTAVSDVSLHVDEGELIALIGPNGAGKTTIFNLLTGVNVPSSGTIKLKVDGKMELLNGKSVHRIADLGMARTFQNIRLFDQLTVLDNVMVGMTSKKHEGMLAEVLRLPSFYRSENEMYQEAMKLLALFKMEEYADQKASNLAYGEQRRLEIARALATKPNLLFLDEPAAGMNPNETADLTQTIQMIQKEFNLAVVLIEHDMNLVMELAKRIYVLEYGKLIAEGTPAEIQNNEEVIRAYLGGDDDVFA
ncbi:ABC transporter ATP-binding protein [Xylocopilactobacillus apicola]|uniref:ABC transporter ATP-binding protein n=1 Tax=Xylocopilactobacillus apicola TaxID=2932184 RepID=A0AAU9DDJ4_9LACO|nr:ABC transporter ATP-binding protein [Xylocopilactobacillus apicola]BDR57885.1 ABC transporter ATP-binding protein [Xylocopilactobacillus apicola]